MTAFHDTEVHYDFGNLSNFNIKPRPKGREYLELMMTIWTNFAETCGLSVEGAIKCMQSRRLTKLGKHQIDRGALVKSRNLLSRR